MKKRLLEHPGLKIASLVLAFFIWLIIVNVSDPIVRRTYTGIPVSVTNGSYIESMGQSYQIASGFDTISVTVRGNRSKIDRLSASSIVANADLTQVIDFNSDPVMVPVTVSVSGIAQDNITANPGNIQLVLEDMESADFVINATAGDTSPSKDYEVGTLTVNPEKLTIRGGKSLVGKIDKVVANVDVSGMSTDSDVSPTISVYDKNGDVLDDLQMSYLNLSVSPGDVKVHVTLYKVLSGVKISAETYGTPAEGYRIGDITETPSEIQVVGDEESLAQFESSGGGINITEGSHAVDVSGASSDVDIKVNISDYLPAGIRLASGLSDTVVVSVKILPYDSRSVEIATRDIKVNNLGADLNAVFTNQTLDIRVRGDNVDKLTADMITASVDLKDAGEGTLTVPVNIVLPAGYSLAEDVTAEVAIVRNTNAADN